MAEVKRIVYNLLLIVGSFACVAADSTGTSPSSPFMLPAGAKVLARDDSGKTWRQNGVVTGGVQTVQAAFSNQLVRTEFKCKHVIPLDENTGRVLEEWRKGDQSLLLMLWPSEKGMTMFSWGISNEYIRTCDMRYLLQ